MTAVVGILISFLVSEVSFDVSVGPTRLLQTANCNG